MNSSVRKLVFEKYFLLVWGRGRGGGCNKLFGNSLCYPALYWVLLALFVTVFIAEL
jgi:hypothetical protein